MSRRKRCCDLDTVCGFSLREGTIFVGVSSIGISVVTLASALDTILSLGNKETIYNNNPRSAINMIFALFCSSTSVYQLIISIMLLWSALWQKGTPFVLSMWFVSHATLLTLYCFMFVARAAICFAAKNYIDALITAVGGLIYYSVFIFFLIIVNSYGISLDPLLYCY